jgi:1-acyl-sn-glycerol-3-phosphate acyltransferase
LIRTIWVALNVIVATVPLSLVAIGAALLGVRGSLYDRLARIWSRWALWASGTRVRVDGAEHIRSDAPKIIVSNHQSWYDVFALAANIPGRYRFVAKQELGRIPLFGRAWRVAGHISVDRADRQTAIRSLEDAGRTIRDDNSSIVIFPEGTRSATGELLPFKKGAFMLAINMGVDIVPTGVSGGRSILAKGDWRVHSGEIVVRFGEPIPTAAYSENNREALIARVRAEVQRLSRARVEAGGGDGGRAHMRALRDRARGRPDGRVVEDPSTAET